MGRFWAVKVRDTANVDIVKSALFTRLDRPNTATYIQHLVPKTNRGANRT